MNTDDPEPTFIRKPELARRLSVKPRTIDEWTRKRIIPYIAVNARLYLFDYDEVLDVLRKKHRIEAR